MEGIPDLVKRAAAGTANVLILGEPGVGKTFWAKTIHKLSARPGNFVTVRCAHESPDRLETQLFGSANHARTGVTAATVGMIEAANGGTLYLQQVGGIPARLQERLLHTLETRALRSAGDAKPRPIDVRLISATSGSLERDVTLTDFRADLFSRLGEIRISLPSLRRRIDELPRLVGRLIDDVCAETSRRPSPRVTSDAMARLRGYGWPGNVRELKDVIRRALSECDGPDILSEHLTVELRPHPPEHLGPPSPPEGEGAGSAQSRQREPHERRILEVIEAVKAREDREHQLPVEPITRRNAGVSAGWSGSRCSLCDQHATHQKRLLGGPSVFICDDCVADAHRVNREAAEQAPSGAAPPRHAPSWSCSFCGRTFAEVRHLVAGAKALVCDDCLDLCDRILGDRLAGEWPAEICAARPFTTVRLIDRLDRRPFEVNADLPLLPPEEAIARARAAGRLLRLINPIDDVPVCGLGIPSDDFSEDDRLVRYGKTVVLRTLYPVATIEATVATARDDIVHGNACRVVVLIDRGGGDAARALIERVKSDFADVAELLEPDATLVRYALVVIGTPRANARPA